MSGKAEKGANIPPIKLYPDKFQDQVVVVSGAAQGIGKSTASLFAQQGAKVVLVDIQEKLVEATTNEINSQGGHAVFKITDISSEKACKQLIKSVIDEFGKIDVLVQLAALVIYGPILDLTTEALYKSFEVNVYSCFYLARAVLPHMRKAGYGRLIQTSSATIQHLFSGLNVYVGTKGALVSMTRSLAIEAGPGITSNAVMPGFIETPGATKGDTSTRESAGTTSMFDYHVDHQCVKRRGQPEDISYGILFLASPEASFISGQTLNIGGGFTFV